MADIIIPIYNALEDLKACLASVETHTDLARHRMVLIDDASTDPGVLAFLRGWAAAHPGTLLFENAQNIGFSVNVNIGLAAGEADVILLNADTLVTSGWAEKLAACAQSDPSIATVSPLSNNATICSVPVFCADNPLPQGHTANSFAALIASCSLRRYPEIPVTVGFCMYIKREAIRRAGPFDAEAFGKGYGEENDFCNRCQQLGYRHALCDDAFVYHAGSASFQSEEKRTLIQEHDRILQNRYPELWRQNRLYYTHNPDHEIQDNIRLALGLAQYPEERKSLLFVCHHDFRAGTKGNRGGVQTHVRDLTEALKNRFNIYVFARDDDRLRLTLYFDDQRLSFAWPAGLEPVYQRDHDLTVTRVLAEVLDHFPIDMISVQQVYHLSNDVFRLAKERGLPVFTTLHDHFYLCPNIKLVAPDGTLCQGGIGAGCDGCMAAQGLRLPASFLADWRENYRGLLGKSAALFAPSVSAAQVYTRFWPELAGKIHMIEHGSAPHNPAAEDLALPAPPLPKQKLNVGFIGGFSKEKGSEAMLQLFRLMELDPVNFIVMGEVMDDALAAHRQNNLLQTGKYQVEEIGRLLAGYEMDLVCLLPQWEETFGYTLSEAVMAGIPVLATDAGAVGARVRGLDCGWVVPIKGCAEAAAGQIRGFLADPTPLLEKHRQVQNIKLKTPAQMAEEYAAFFDGVPASGGQMAPQDILREAYFTAHRPKPIAPEDYAGLLAQNQIAMAELHAIHSAKSYRMLVRLNKIISRVLGR